MSGDINIKDVLETIEVKINKTSNVSKIVGLCFNKWLLASAMQKSIRRGNTSCALSATVSLFHIDKRMLWRRLSIIALEDIGLGDIQAVSETLAISALTFWRKRIGELNTAIYATEMLSKAIKSRTCTDAYIVSDMGESCQIERNELPLLNNNELVKLVLNRKNSIIIRVLSLWLIAGTDRYRTDNLPKRKGDLALAIELMKEMDAPINIINCCILHLKKSQYPLALLMPLIIDVYSKQQGEVINTKLEDNNIVDRLPLYALDGLYTRDGKICIREWKKQYSALMPYSVQLIAMAIFWFEGSVLNKEWQNQAVQELKLQSMKADFYSIGYYSDEYDDLIKIIKAGLPELMKIRKKHLLSTKKTDLFESNI